MTKNILSKNLNSQDAIKTMRQIGAGIKSELKKEIRELGVKIESVEHKVDLLSENQTVMKKKLDATFEMVGELSEDITTVKDDIKILRDDVSMVKEDVKSIKGELKKKVDMEKFVVLEKKVTAKI